LLTPAQDSCKKAGTISPFEAYSMPAFFKDIRAVVITSIEMGLARKT